MKQLIHQYLAVFLLFTALIMCLTGRLAHASDLETTRGAAHIGVSFALETLTYGFYSKAFTMPRPQALYFSILTTIVIGLTYKEMELMNTPGKGSGDLGRSMLQNAIGTGIAVGGICVYQW